MKPLQALLLLTAVLTAQPRASLNTGLETIRAATLKADLTFLASDALEGRMSLERGNDVAIQWIASEFTKAGLKPAFAGTYLQPVPLVEYRMDRDQTSLTIRVNGAPQTFHAPDAVGNYPNDGTYKGAVAFAGFGITAPELHYDDYSTIDATGKIVIVFNHEPQEDDASSIFNGKGNTRYANPHRKC